MRVLRQIVGRGKVESTSLAQFLAQWSGFVSISDKTTSFHHSDIKLRLKICLLTSDRANV
jgi:hypothetical protein